MSSRDITFAAAGARGGAGSSDPNFRNVSLLLTGNGTNGAQNNTFRDSSTNNFTITRNGNTTQGSFSPYGPNWSNYFSGNSSNYLSIASTSALTLSGDFTVEGWFYVIDTSAGFKRIFNNAPGTTPSGFFYVYTNGTEIRFYNADRSLSFNMGSFTGNSWFHLAISRSGSTTRVFINGIQTSSYSGSQTFTNNGWFIGGGPDTEFSNVYISNHRVVVGTALYTANFTPSITPLTAVSGTALLTCQSNRFRDASANNLAITINGTPLVQRFSPFNPTAPYSTSVIGGSAYFDGNGDYVYTASPSSAFNYGTGNFTIEFWVYPLAGPSNLYNPSFFTNHAVGSWSDVNGIRIHHQNTIFGAGTFSLTYTNPVQNNTWTHIAIVRNGSTITAYLNGVANGSISNNSVLGSDTDQIGLATSDEATTGGREFLNGYISDLRIVKGTAVYTSAFTPPTTPLPTITNTSILLNMVNAGIPDAAMMNNVETVGDARVSTAVVKYGTGSLAFDGSGDYLAIPRSENFVFGSGDFTVEFWARINSTGVQVFFDTRPADNSGTPFVIYIDGSSNLIFASPSSPRIAGGVLSINIWYHIAVSRSGTSTRMFINGTQTGSTYSDSNIYTCGAARPLVGIAGFSFGVAALNGYMDDLRVTKGLARYTANFTPPAAAFPTF